MSSTVSLKKTGRKPRRHHNETKPYALPSPLETKSQHFHVNIITSIFRSPRAPSSYIPSWCYFLLRGQNIKTDRWHKPGTPHTTGRAQTDSQSVKSQTDRQTDTLFVVSKLHTEKKKAQNKKRKKKDRTRSSTTTSKPTQLCSKEGGTGDGLKRCNQPTARKRRRGSRLNTGKLPGFFPCKHCNQSPA